MANEIFGSELNVDFSGILQQAEAFDEKLKDIDHTAKQLGNTLRNALGNIDLGGLKSLKDNIERLGESKISLKVVGTEELGKMSSALDTIISQVDVFSRQGVGIFDSKALYSDNNNVLEISSSLEKIEQKISKLKEAWKTIGTSEQLAASDEVFKGFVPPTHKNGTEYKPESKTYQNAMREHLEAQARIAIEEKAIMTESLNWAKMTEDEKSAYIEKKLKDTLRAEEQFARGVKKEYADTVNEMVSLMKQTDQLNKKNTDGSITPQIKQLESRFAELNSKRVQLEQQYGEYVVDIAQKTNSKVLAIEANRILEKNKKEKEELEKWYSTASGAKYKADTAHTIGEKEDAMGYLKTAMKNTYSPELMDELRNKYQELRIAVEEHKKALNGELSLQPTVRAEYMRLRKELDSVLESKEKLSKTEAYKSGDAVAKSDYNTMVAREEDIQAKLVQIRKNAQGLLDAVDREYESKRAQNRVKEYEKAEQQIANKQTVAPKTSALFDLEDLEKQKAAATEAVKAVEVEIQKLEPQLNAAIQERINAVGDISEQSKKEIAELQSQIANMRELAGGANSRQELMQYVAQIQELRNKIEAVKKTEAELLSADASTENSSVNQLTNSMDELYEKMRLAEEKVRDLDAEMDSKLESNIAVEEQIKKIEEWKAKIKELEDDFTRLNAAGKAFGSDGKLTSEGADLTNRKAQLEEELKLMQMNASEAKRYSDSIIAQEQREADLAIQEEQRTTNAKIAEYNRLVSEEARLRKEAREQRKAIDNENLDPIGKSQAQTALDATVEEQQRVADRMVEIERELGDELNSIKQKALAAQLREVIRNNDEMLREQERAAREQERIEKENKKLEQEAEKAHYTENPQAAIDFSKSTQSINEQIKALQYLKAARDNLTVSAAGGESAYKQKIEELNKAISQTQENLDELTDKHKDLGEEQSNLISISNSLENKLLTLFGIDAIKGYIQKIVDVRKEFEYQQKSLQVLLQSKEEADKLWGQTVDLALRSPMRVKELVTYTKQLAAYKIETDKLHDSTKRLADVSSGLGVDMQRLILAFGQVRAAEFLRGTELRQFTEAGIPMLEELAKYFSEIEGKAVTTGEVFERISRRAVLFSDVEEVFHRITNEGGTFYQMQEKQADTMHGTISNLHDQIDLMLNDVGASNQDLIMSVLNVAKGFISSWREIRDQIFAVGSALVICKLAQLAFNKAMALGITHLKLFKQGATSVDLALVSLMKRYRAARISGQLFNAFLLGSRIVLRAFALSLKAIGATLMSMVPFLIITGIMELIFWIGEADSAARSFAEGATQINKEVSTQKNDAVAHYRRLAETINDVTTSENERVEALKELKRVFGEILPDHMLEAKYIAEKAGKWEEAKEAMNVYYNDLAVQQKKAKVEEVYGGEVEKNKADLKMDIYDILDLDEAKTLIDSKYGTGMAQVIRDGMGKAIENATEKIKSGEIENSSAAFWNAVSESLSRYSGATIKNIQADLLSSSTGAIDMWEGFGMDKNVEELIGNLNDYNNAIKGIDGLPDETHKMEQNRKAASAYTDKLKDLGTAIKDLNGAYSKMNKLIESKPKEDADKGEIASYEKRKKEIEEEIRNKYKSLGVKIPVEMDVSAIAQSSHLIEQETNRVGQAAYTNLSLVASIGGQITDEALGAEGGIQGLYDRISSLKNPILEVGENGSWTGMVLSDAADGSGTFWINFSNKLRDEVIPNVLQVGETAQNMADELDPTPLMLFTDGVIDSVAEAMGLTTDLFDNIRMEQGQSLADFHKAVKQESDATLSDYLELKKVIESNPTNAVYVQSFIQAKGYESIEEAKAGMKQMQTELRAYAQILNRTGYVAKNTKKSKAPKKKKTKSKKTKNSDDPAENLYDFLGEIYDAFQDFNEEMSAEAANAKIAEIYGKEFEKLERKVKGLDLKLPEFKQDDEKPYLDALDAVLKQATKKTQEKIKDEKRKAEKEQEVDDAKELNDETERYIDFLFEQHELYKELKELGVSEKHAKALFGLDVASLKDINKELERLKKQGKLAGTRMAEVELEAQGKIAEEERSIQEERLKTYIEYANKAVSERAKIELEYLNEMAEIEEATLIRPEDSEEAIMYKNTIREENTKKALKEYQEGLQKLEWDEFQKSDTFIMMFEDLEFASEKLIRSTLEDLRNFKGEWANMPLEDMRAMISKINELEGSLLKLQNPFKVTKKLKKELKGLYLPDLQMEAKEFESEIKENDNIIAQLETIRDLRKRGIGLEEYQVNLLYEVGLAENSTVYAINGMIAAREEANSKAKSALGLTLDQINKFKELKKSYDAQKAVIETITEKAREVYDAFSELFKLFADEDSIGFAFAEMGMSMAESVAQAMVLQLQVTQTEIAMKSAGIEADSFAMKLNAAMGVVGWIVMGVQVISQVLGAIFGAKDKKLQKDIDKLDEDIETLSKALEKLEDALEKNYAFESLRSDMQEINSNIDEQIAKRRRQIYLEKKKKETDKDQIKDWEDEIEELEEERAEAHRKMVESLGGVDDYRSATREFVDAWVEAFNETGNGLQGLKDNFREFFKNIILEQAVMKGAGKIMEPLLDKINMSLDDYEIQGHEEQKIKALSEQKMKELDEFLNGLFGDNGMWNEWIDDKGQSLSGLQEGIQGVTEETAQIIEAYLNSIRFYIAQDNQNLADLRNFFIGSEEDTNPMLSQLRIIAQQTTAIYDLLDSVSRSGHSQGGKGIKVFID